MGSFFWHRTGGYAIPHCKTIALCFRQIEFHARNMTSCPGYPYCLWPIETVLKLAVWAHSGSVKLGINGSRLHIPAPTLYVFESALQQLCNGVSHAPVRRQEPTWVCSGAHARTLDARSKTDGNIYFSNLNIQIGPETLTILHESSLKRYNKRSAAVI